MRLFDEEICKLVPKSAMNGAGPKGFGWLVPDQLGLLNIHAAADIHDASYFFLALPYEAKRRLIANNNSRCMHLKIVRKPSKATADRVFYDNLTLMNKCNSKTKFGYGFRKPIIWGYYIAVKIFGSAFIRR